MISFILSLVALIVGYLIYGRFVERIFGPDENRPTPAVSMADGVDYIVMPSWKVFMIQFLNIAVCYDNDPAAFTVQFFHAFRKFVKGRFRIDVICKSVVLFHIDRICYIYILFVCHNHSIIQLFTV